MVEHYCHQNFSIIIFLEKKNLINMIHRLRPLMVKVLFNGLVQGNNVTE